MATIRQEFDVPKREFTGGVEIDCEARVPLCGAACCRLGVGPLEPRTCARGSCAGTRPSPTPSSAATTAGASTWSAARAAARSTTPARSPAAASTAARTAASGSTSRGGSPTRRSPTPTSTRSPIPDKKLGGAKDLGYARGAVQDRRQRRPRRSPRSRPRRRRARRAGDVTLKGAGGVNAGRRDQVPGGGDRRVREARRRHPRRLHPEGEGRRRGRGKDGSKLGARGVARGPAVRAEVRLHRDRRHTRRRSSSPRWRPRVELEDHASGPTRRATAPTSRSRRRPRRRSPSSPNYKRILQAILEEGGARARRRSRSTPPCWPGRRCSPPSIIGQGIYMAGEKGELHKGILEGAVNARQAPRWSTPRS